MQLITEGKTNWKYILIVVVLAFLVGGGVWFYKEEEICLDCFGPPISGGPETKNETADWKTYRNEEYGFEVEYPESYFIKEVNVSLPPDEAVPEDHVAGYQYEKPVAPLFYLEFYPSPDLKYEEIEVAVYNANNLTIDEWLDYINKGVRQYLIYEGRIVSNREPISFIGIESIRGRSGCCGVCIINIFTPKGSKIYDIKQIGSVADFHPDSGECSGYDEKYNCCFKNEKIFEQMLSTFRFLD